MTKNRLQKQDPREQYATPPFAKQPQPAPGLASEMQPRPDHGETSYQGAAKLQGRKALVTGGDSGVGRAAAIAFAREGADVAIAYLPSEERDAQEVLALIKAEGRKAFGFPGDNTNEAFSQSLPQKALEALGGLDILVNNAGSQATQPKLADITTEQFDHTLKTNLYGLFWITKAALPLLEAGSSIINTASVQAFHPSQGIIDYAMTKAAIVAFTKGLAPQLMEQGIRINAVAPGPFWTPIQTSGGQTQEKVVTLGKQVPLGRPGQPVELAPVYVLLASQEGSYITGEVFGVTGGIGIV